MAVKKGIFFTVDAIIAVSIILGTLLVITKFYIHETPSTTLDYTAGDVVSTLSQLSVSECDNGVLLQLVQDRNVTLVNSSVLTALGELWSKGQDDAAAQLFDNITRGLVPSNIGLALLIDSHQLFSRNNTVRSSLSTSSKLVSGIDRFVPIEGYVAQTYLYARHLRTRDAIYYFGGFAGQGNITGTMFIPESDANITAVILELHSNQEFELYINGHQCLSQFPATTGEFDADTYDVTSCKGDIAANSTSHFTLVYSGNINSAYVTGGYVKVRYQTEESVPSVEEAGADSYYLPGIEGVINIYSSITSPGTLTAWRLNMTLLSNFSIFVVLGNETIVNVSGSEGVQSIYRERNGLFIPAGTIPLRVGVTNVSMGTSYTAGVPSDVILVTDTSGSMDECAAYPNPLVCHYHCRVGGDKTCTVDDESDCSSPHKPCPGYCKNPSNYELICYTKLEIAQSAGNTFVDTVLNTTGNNIGLVAYSTDVVSSLPLTDDKPTLYARVNSYSANGATCICCGINGARNLVAASEKNQAIVVMSDGAATVYCNSYDDFTGSGTGGTSDAIDRQWAIDAGQYACSLGIDVYSVGFGVDADHDTLRQIACNESMYYNASDVEDLSFVYQAIGSEIILKANYSAQMMNFTGNVTFTKLFDSSFFEFDFTPPVPEESYGQVLVSQDLPRLTNCTAQFYLYPDITPTDMKLGSYSSIYWTDLVIVNGVAVWNLSEYGGEYRSLGDPFAIQIPIGPLVAGYNNISIKTGADYLNNTGCSEDNLFLVYRGRVQASVSYTSVLPYAEGCKWAVEFDDNTTSNISIPAGYGGSKSCRFTESLVSYDVNDTIDAAVFSLLSRLDFDDNHKSNVNIADMDLDIRSLVVPSVPSLWGPAAIEVRSW